MSPSGQWKREVPPLQAHSMYVLFYCNLLVFCYGNAEWGGPCVYNICLFVVEKFAQYLTPPGKKGVSLKLGLAPCTVVEASKMVSTGTSAFPASLPAAQKIDLPNRKVWSHETEPIIWRKRRCIPLYP